MLSSTAFRFGCLVTFAAILIVSSPIPRYVFGVESWGSRTNEGLTSIPMDQKLAGGGDVTVTFRNGVNGYTGTVDTFLRAEQPTTSQGANQELQWDLEESGANSPQFALVRFDGIFGNGAGQIPSGIFVTSAALTYTVFEAGDGSDVNEAAVTWDETSTYNNFGGEAGVQPDEYGTYVDSTVGNPVGTYSIDVTSSVAAWVSNPSLNRGWVFRPLGTDGVDARSSEYTTVANRPLLSVTYSTVQPNRPPNTPVIVLPTDGATGVVTNPDMIVNVSDPDGDPLTVTYFGRLKSAAPAPDFTIIAVPDTQNYADGAPNGDESIMYSQLQWIASQRAARNIAFVTQLGDCVQNGDNGGNDIEWQRADTAWDFVEVPYAGFPHGIPYGIAVGNHDQSPNGDPNGTTTFFNQFFGEVRFQGRAYYGGHYGTNNDNHYQLFSASGMDFIIIHLEYDPAANPAVLAWANGLLQANPTRRGIVVSHHFVNIGNPGSFGTQGQATYNALRGNPNFFLMLNGHVHGEGRRQDTFNGSTVNSLLSDYQARTNGGDGWLRIMTFKPSLNQVDVQTYSTTLGQFETDADSQFSFTYDMSGSGSPFTQIGQNTNVPGLTSLSSFTWTGRAAGSDYEWYVGVTDGEFTVTSPILDFRTLGATAANVSVSGRVISADGRGIRNAMLTLSDRKGSLVMARSNSFGYFRFDNVAAGVTYALEARAKGRTFPTQVISVVDNIEKIEVIADQ